MNKQAQQTVRGLVLNTMPLEWFCVNDVVMGGRSEATVSACPDGIRFTGNVSTVGGGFASARTLDAPLGISNTARAIRVAFTADAARYKLKLSTSSMLEGQRGKVTWQCSLPAQTEEVQTSVLVPFVDFNATMRGQPVPDAKLDLESICSIGVMCSIFDDYGNAEPEVTGGDFQFTLSMVDVE